VVEPRGRRPGHRPRPPYRPAARGDRLPARGEGHRGGEDPDAQGPQARARRGRHRRERRAAPGPHRRRPRRAPRRCRLRLKAPPPGAAAAGAWATRSAAS
jgi:hypothetical protein